MTVLSLLFASLVTVAYPRAGQMMPSVARTYMIGSVSSDITNLVIAGETVLPYRTGAWATSVPLAEGMNEIQLVWQTRMETGTNVFTLTVPYKSKVYPKLSYAKDEPTISSVTNSPAETVIYLDPGHGGSDSGAISPHGWFEKDANLALALATAERLRLRGYQVKMTRDDDRAIDLYERARAAHHEGAAAFVSIHHNAPNCEADPFQRYSCVYAWNALGDPLARAIADSLADGAGEPLASRGALRANFAVTRSPEIASCLVEADFISAPAGEEASFDPLRQAERARAIAAGIDAWHRQVVDSLKKTDCEGPYSPRK